MSFNTTKFQRVFSKSMYKTLKLPLGEMTFSKNFIDNTCGDIYPIIAKDKTCIENVAGHQYSVQNGSVERMFARFFPYATYEFSFKELNGSCGFAFHLQEQKVELLCNTNQFVFSDEVFVQTVELSKPLFNGVVIISCRPGAFDVYLQENGKPNYFCTFKTDTFANSNDKKQFDRGFVSLLINGNCIIDSVSSYIDCGISQADIRAICYENGDPIFENGQIYFTASVRLQEGGFQGVFSWKPTTSIIELVGALFFDVGDGFWRNFLASSIKFNRNTKEWYIWTSSFEHKHILCYASFAGDPRFGVNVIDVTFMQPADKNEITDFVGFRSDEDPDFYYDEEKKKWTMAICRIFPVDNKYRYIFFESDKPFSDYTYIRQGYEGTETGGSFVKIDNEMTFICGNDYEKRANYRIYTKERMHEAEFDFNDGGFRGWGTIIPISMGSRKRYFWLTFDRHNGSSYNWSYGNIYCFEALT